MLTPPDGRPDGGNIRYLEKPERWRQFDPPLFDHLQWMATDPSRRRVALIEERDVIPGAKYISETLSDVVSERRAYFKLAHQTLSGAELVFFDPDIGLPVPSTPKGRRNSAKFLYLDEIAAFYDSGHSVLVYQHFARVKRDKFITQKIEELRQVAGKAAIQPIITPHTAFLLAKNPRHPNLQLGPFPDPPLLR
ncbi:MAG: hypothetical protein WD942_07610 [Dehalococcoidia bacterium]